MSELHLRVFNHRSELVLADGTTQVFLEGAMNEATKQRYQKILSELSDNYLEKQIIYCRDNVAQIDFLQINQNYIDKLKKAGRFSYK